MMMSLRDRMTRLIRVVTLDKLKLTKRASQQVLIVEKM